MCKKVSETAREADQSMARKLAHKYNHTGKLDNINIPVIQSIQHVWRLQTLNKKLSYDKLNVVYREISITAKWYK